MVPVHGVPLRVLPTRRAHHAAVFGRPPDVFLNAERGLADLVDVRIHLAGLVPCDDLRPLLCEATDQADFFLQRPAFRERLLAHGLIDRPGNAPDVVRRNFADQVGGLHRSQTHRHRDVRGVQNHGHVDAEGFAHGPPQLLLGDDVHIQRPTPGQPFRLP